MLEVRTDILWITLTDQPLGTEAAADFLREEAAGGIDLFLGTTRRWTAGRETVELEYEAFAPMAVEEMRRIAERACGRWPLTRVVLHHRTGIVAVKESSVIVGASSPHRASAFEATRFLIDELKEEVPIWKRERYADGETEWVEGTRTHRSMKQQSPS